MSSRQRTFGQFETPPDVADLLLGFCLRRPSDRVLDPSCGDGALLRLALQWQEWLADRSSDISADGLWGVELDQEAAKSAQANLPQAHILTQNFFTLAPDTHKAFDAIIGNPPYTRAEWFDRLHREAGQQLALGLEETIPAASEETRPHLLPRPLWAQLDGRSGLHAYFFLHSTSFLREGGRLGFVVPNGWLDVAYGHKLKQFILDHFQIIALIESGVERWFHDAKVNTCLVILEKCDDPMRRRTNRVRMIRLKRRLQNLIPAAQQTHRRYTYLERLVPRLMPGESRRTDEFAVRVIPQQDLDAGDKWGLALRAPAVYRRHLDLPQTAPLKEWAAIRRGYTTGANAFFYLTPAVIKKWEIEPLFRRPILKSLRGIDRLRLKSDSCRHEILCVPGSAELDGTAVAEYITWGEQQNYHLRRTCAGRRPWYSLPEQPWAQIVLPKGIWRRHFAVVLDDMLPIDQQLYGLSLSPGVSPLAAAALLNSAWFALQCELRGRINFGEGVLWLAAYETGDMHLPDPRRLQPAEVGELEQQFLRLAQRPLQNIESELSRPDRQALDTIVFDLLGFSRAERSAVLDALLDSIETRLRRAEAGP